MSDKIKVNIYSAGPLFISASPDEFGRVFSAMSSVDQVNVLRSMIKHMEPHKTQWDYISIELDRPENADVLHAFRQMVQS